MARRAIRIGMWSFAALLIAVTAILFLINSSSVQTRIARKILATLNANWPGDIDVDRIHALWDGTVQMEGIKLRDERGIIYFSADSLRAQIDYRMLLHNSVWIQAATFTGVEINLQMDSSGSLNVSRSFATTSKDSTSSSRSPWVVVLDDISLQGKELLVTFDKTLWIEAANWQAAGAVKIDTDSLTYSATLDAPEWLQIDAGGELSLTSPTIEMNGLVGFIANERLLYSLPAPLNQTGSWSGHAQYALSSDTLQTNYDIQLGTLGQAIGSAVVPLDLSLHSMRISATLDSVHPGILWGDSTVSAISGSVQAEKMSSLDWLSPWEITGDLQDVRYGEYHAWRLSFTTMIGDSLVNLHAKVYTITGSADVVATMDALHGEPFSGTFNLNTNKFALSEVANNFPDSVLAFTGRANGTFSWSAAAGLQLQSKFKLSGAGTTTWPFDSLSGQLTVDGDRVIIDTLSAKFGGLQIFGAGDYGERGYDGDITIRSNDLSQLRATALADFIPDSLSGSALVHLQVESDSVKSIPAKTVMRGDVVITDFALGAIRAEQLTAKIIRFEPESSRLHAAAHIKRINVSGQPLDSATIVARGSLDELNLQLQLWAITDTADVRADMTISQTANTIQIALHQLVALTYGIPWKTEGESQITIENHTISVDALVLDSDYGKLIASGAISSPGQQDLAVELSGFQLADWAKLFKQTAPAGLLNARIMISGPDTNIVGDLSATIDSVRYESQMLADRVTVEAEANNIVTSFRALYTLSGDTVATARGSFPIRLTFSDGIILNSELPMVSEVKLLDRPWQLSYPLLPYGTTLSGSLSGAFTVTGSPARPDWSGDLDYRGGSYQDTRYGLDYREINADFTLARDTLRVDNLRLQSTGTLTGSGEILMSFPLPKQVNLSLNFDNFAAVESRNLKARLSGSTTLRGPVDSLNAEGRARFSEGAYRITQSTTKQIEEIDLTAELAVLRGDTTDKRGILASQFYRPMTHALFIEIPGNVWLRGAGLNVELMGELWMHKERNAEPSINGEIKVKRGSVDFVGHEFKVDQDSGAVIFTGAIDDPEVNIIAIEQSLLRTTGDQIRVRVFGTLQNTQMELSGVRADGGVMSIEDVLQTLFGAYLPLASSSAPTDLTGSIATAGISQLSGLVGKLAGLDVFQFRSGSGGVADLSGSALEVGTYLTDRLYIRVLQPVESVQGNQDVLVEYRLFDWLKLAGHQTGTESSEFKTVLQWEWR